MRFNPRNGNDQKGIERRAIDRLAEDLGCGVLGDDECREVIEDIERFDELTGPACPKVVCEEDRFARERRDLLGKMIAARMPAYSIGTDLYILGLRHGFEMRRDHR